MKHTVLLLSIITLGAADGAFAQEEQYTLTGVGAASCGQWIEGRARHDSNVDMQFAAWVQGFLGGMNAQEFILTKQPMKLLPDHSSILAYVDKYCRDNPLEGVFEASVHLYQAIEKRQVSK